MKKENKKEISITNKIPKKYIIIVGILLAIIIVLTSLYFILTPKIELKFIL